MKVRFKTIAASPEGVIQVGQVVDVDNKFGKALLEGDYAELVDAPAEPAEAPAEAEVVKPATKRSRKKVE